MVSIHQRITAVRINITTTHNNEMTAYGGQSRVVYDTTIMYLLFQTAGETDNEREEQTETFVWGAA